MNCPKCQSSNRETANFCKNCGSLLLQSCPRCNIDLPEAASFCDNCGLTLVDKSTTIWWDRPGTKADHISASQVDKKPKVSQPASSPPSSAASPAPPETAPISPVPAAAPPDAGDSQLQQYIPRELMAKLEAAQTRGKMVGERRVVTMLFCDVKGSTAAAENMDPEDWTDVINSAFEHMIRPIYKFEGTVARLMGDGLLAFFGAPIAHEDDPERAVLAGLDIIAALKSYSDQVVQQHGIDFNVRVGINTGLVVVGAVGSDLRMEYTAIGDAINLAARMEQTAVPGTVQIALDTYKLVQAMFHFEDLGGIEVKGRNEPVQAYRVVGRKAISGQKRGIEGLHAEMVGREAELLVLHDVMADLKQGVGRIVCVLGDAGLGKSRLVNESYRDFKELIGPDGNWFETLSLSYEASQAYGLFRRLIRRITGIAYDDPVALVREKLAALLEGLPAERRPLADQLFEALYGLEMQNGDLLLEGESFKRELFETIRTVWQIQFSNRPTVMVFDDMHWSDAASIDLLLQLLPLTEEIPLVLLCAMRSERHLPAWQIKTTSDQEFHHRYAELLLRPLSEAESNELVDRLLKDVDLPDRLRANILEKSAGNPFFIEEVVRTLIESGMVISKERTVNGSAERYWRVTGREVDLTIPDNLQSLLAARLDRLEEATRGTLQVASVIGRSFPHRVLQAVDEASPELDRRLDTLLRLDMIREAARVPEVEYAFRNPLTQEAVYQTILIKRRREFHLRVAEAMEALYPDRLEVFSGLLAHHYLLAGQRDRAIEYSRRAASQAIKLFAYEEAIQNLRAALELIKPGEKSAIHSALLEELADVYRLLREGDQAIALYQEALEVWRGLEEANEATAMRLHRKIVQVVIDLKWSVEMDHLQQANESRLVSLSTLKDGLERMQSGPPNPETVRVVAVLSTDAWRIQDPPDWEAAQRYAQAAVDMAEKLDSPVDLSQALGALANIMDGRSLLREHLRVAQRRLEISRGLQFDNVYESIEALRSAGAGHMYVGEYQQALPFLKEAEALATRAQVVEQQVIAQGLQAQCWYRLDRWDEVLATEELWRQQERRYSRERVGGT